MIDSKVKHIIDNSVLCWLATSDENNQPNVSPKEMFTHYGKHALLIANIASPNSIDNIRYNQNVCVSLVDVFSQKGFKLKGLAQIVEKADTTYNEKKKLLTDQFSDKFPIKEVIEVSISKIEPIVAPSYYLFPNTTEADQIKSAMKTYGVKPAE